MLHLTKSGKFIFPLQHHFFGTILSHGSKFNGIQCWKAIRSLHSLAKFRVRKFILDPLAPRRCVTRNLSLNHIQWTPAKKIRGHKPTLYLRSFALIYCGPGSHNPWQFWDPNQDITRYNKSNSSGLNGIKLNFGVIVVVLVVKPFRNSFQRHYTIRLMRWLWCTATLLSPS